MKLRQLRGTDSTMLEAWGARSLYDDGVDAAARAAFTSRIAGYSPGIIWLAIGTADYLAAPWTAANFQTAYADLLVKLHAALPSASIYAQSPVTLSAALELTANAQGDLPSAYRTAISNACSGKAYVTFVDGSGFILVTDLDADGVHPNTTGHNKIYLAVKSALGL
jgi:lysophospholipase L1-like esterase